MFPLDITGKINHARLWMQWGGALIGFVTYNTKFLLVFGFGSVYGYACSSVCVSGVMQEFLYTSYFGPGDFSCDDLSSDRWSLQFSSQLL
ncbi:hypothetical protein RIF29_16771 [Crotalaria pallida]|uniref:Uncharacterized protein n=1 Tax=Crotalaria pallida TaxID=3830 RepID=A0AAN9IK26_CROPI